MYDFIARANIDHYVELLSRDDTPSNQGSVICKLLIEEENKLATIWSSLSLQKAGSHGIGKA